MTLFVPRYSQLVGDGNSLTVGSGATTPLTQNWMAQCRALLATSQSANPEDYWGMVNLGTGSIKTSDLIARFATTVHPLFNAGRKRNVVSFLEVINDIRHGNVTDEQALANVLAYIAQARSLGWDVLLFSVPPTGPADTLDDGFPGVTTGPALVSAYLRANVASLSPFPLVDIAVAGKLDTPTDTALWHADQVHPTENGYAIMAQAVHDILTAL